MKNKFGILSVLILTAWFTGCDDAYEIDYEAPVKIVFEGADNGIAVIGKGADRYTADIVVKAQRGVSYVEIYAADPATGAKGALIEGSGREVDAEKEYRAEFTLADLTDNTCIRISATDTEGAVAERNLLVKITPAVLFSGPVTMETADDYYGSYYASWLDGRVYLRSNGEQYAGEIDFTLGMVDGVPSLVSPGKRSSLHLPSPAGLQETEFALTGLTLAEYDRISKIDSAPIVALPEPARSVVGIEPGKVYLFKTAGGEIGLIAIREMTQRTGTIESAGGEWIEDTPYYRVALTTKIVAPY